MKFLVLVFLMILPPMPLARADANEEEFTVKVEHYEMPRTPGFSEDEFRGRAWDLRNVLESARFPSGVQWLRESNERPGQAEGSTYCVRISPPRSGGRSLAIAPEQREQTLINLLIQLRQRNAEMRADGAHFRVESPSRCASEPVVRFARRK
jgi:hypothetical protein